MVLQVYMYMCVFIYVHTEYMEILWYAFCVMGIKADTLS